MLNIKFAKILAGTAAAAFIATFAAGGTAFAHGMGHMGSMGSGPHTLNLTQTKTTVSKIRDHDRFRHRRFFAFGYVAPDYACVYKRTIDGRLVRICPEDWY
jgi:hypothetical protein